MQVVAGIIDIGTGNIHSLYRALSSLGAVVILCSDQLAMQKADKLILPGVGHYGRACRYIKENGLTDILKEEIQVRKKHVLGVCLGMQLLASRSEEDKTVEGLGLVGGVVRRLKVSDTSRFKVPHLGWNNLSVIRNSPLLSGITDKDEFYFMHSYCFEDASQEHVLANTEYESPFISCISEQNVFGVQFHPEKSHHSGKKLLQNFLSL